MLRTFLIVLPLTVSLLSAQADLWMTDFAKAKEKAKAEKKDLLIDFTGSDWCGWCMKLDEEVFSQDAFTAAAPKSFVLVKLDYPRTKELPPELKEQNKKLAEQYPIQGYPTILLTSADGVVYAQTGYQPDGPEKYLTMLGEMQAKGAAFQKALAAATDKKAGERAKALDAALATLDEDVVNAHHFACMEEIVALDADGKAGLKEKYETRVKTIGDGRAIDREAQALNELVGPLMQEGKGEEALTKVAEIVKAPKNKVQHQLALFFLGMLTMDVKEDAKAAIAALEEAKKIAPESPIGKRIDELLPQLKEVAEKKGDKKDEKGGK